MDNISKENVQELDPEAGQVIELDPEVGQVMELDSEVGQVMELHPEVNQVMELNPEAGQVVESNTDDREAAPDIFSNSVILNHILDLFPNSELLELSFVGKVWKKEARVVMKKRGNVMAHLEREGFVGCGLVFKAFAANMDTMNEALYSGIIIWIRPSVECAGTTAPEVEHIQESILAGMRGNLKYLSIRLEYPEVCWNARDCPSLHLLRLLLRDLIGDLEHLRLQIRKIIEPFVQRFLPQGPYPKLKVLELTDSYVDEEIFGNQIRMFLSRAPNLQEIHTHGSVSLRVNFVEGRQGVVRVHQSYVHNPLQDISENVIPALRLKRIQLYATERELNLDRFNEKAKSLLRICCATTLERLDLERKSAVLFMSYGIVLVNLKELRIVLDYLELERLEPRIKSIMTQFDFTHFLPNLKKVVVVNTSLRLYDMSPHNMMAAIIEQANAVLREPTLRRPGNIKYLNLDQSSFPVTALQFFSQMFPHIEELEMRADDEVVPVGAAWEHWPDLKRMKVEGKWYERP